MNNRKSLIRKVLKSVIPTVEFTGNLLYLPIMDGVLRGFVIEKAPSHGDKVRLSAFVQSLYIPSEEIALYLSCELRNANGMEWWSFKDEKELAHLGIQVRKAKSQFLDMYATPKKIAKLDLKCRRKDLYLQQEYAYALAFCGWYPKAQKAFGELVDMVTEPSAFDWEANIKARALDLADKCEKNPEHVRKALEQQISLTGKMLRLKF